MNQLLAEQLQPDFPLIEGALSAENTLVEGLPTPETFFYLAAQLHGEKFAQERLELFSQQREAAKEDIRNLLQTELAKQTDISAKFKISTALSRLDYYANRIAIDANMPLGVGGSFALDDEFISISAMPSLYAEAGDVYHIIAHELLHGMDLHLELFNQEETAIDQIATSLRISRGFPAPTGTGYRGQLELLGEFAGEITAAELLSLAHADARITLVNYIDRTLFNPDTFDSSALTKESMWERIEQNWQMLCELFPRLINNLGSRATELHDPVVVTYQNFKQQIGFIMEMKVMEKLHQES
jgi:hypothetical protein